MVIGLSVKTPAINSPGYWAFYVKPACHRADVGGPFMSNRLAIEPRLVGSHVRTACHLAEVGFI